MTKDISQLSHRATRPGVVVPMMRRVQRWARRQQTQDRLCARLLPHLAALAPDDGSGIVRVIDLARMVGVSSRAAREHLRHLEAAGLLVFGAATAVGIPSVSVHQAYPFRLCLAELDTPQRVAL